MAHLRHHHQLYNVLSGDGRVLGAEAWAFGLVDLRMDYVTLMVALSLERFWNAACNGSSGCFGFGIRIVCSSRY